jgi:N-acyl amino acid synthase of PEP-CTERM/exosortase system
MAQTITLDTALPAPRSPQDVPLEESYRRFFTAVPADTDELLREAHRLRYQVYCVEHPYEDASANSDGLERDEFDAHSVHGVLLHRGTGSTVGTVRLVLHRPGAVTPSLPIYHVCDDPRLAALPPESTVELSRFAISKFFRRRVGDGDYGKFHDCQDLAADLRRVIPFFTLGLFTVALQLGIANGTTHVCAVMEPALLRLVARFGFHFHPVGPLVDYHGERQPCFNTVEALMAGVEAERPDFWNVITDCGRLWAPRLHSQRPLEAFG